MADTTHSLKLRRGSIFFILASYLLIINSNNGFIPQFLLFCAALYVILPFKRYFDKMALAIALYAISYSVLNGLVNSFEISGFMVDLFTPVAFYMLGQYLGDTADSQDVIIRRLGIITLCFGSLLYASTFIAILNVGLVNPMRELSYIFGGHNISATQVGIYISLGFVGLGAFFVLRTNRTNRYLFLLAFFLSIITTLHLINRTGLFISVIALIVMLCYFYRRYAKFLLVIGFVLAFAVLFYSKSQKSSNDDNGAITEAYASREMSDEGNLANGGDRTNRWIVALKQIPSSPLGWQTNNNKDYFMHNMWLDIAKNAGWIPLICILWVTFLAIYYQLLIFKRKVTQTYAILIGLNVCIFLVSFVEPIIGGVFFAVCCMIWGIEKSCLTSSLMNC